MLHIFTLWYGRKYPVDNVNNLYKSLKKHYKKPFKFYCYTDKPKELGRGIKPIVLNRTIRPAIEGAWHKIDFFQDNFVKYGKNDECICLDIDVEIIKDPSPIFDIKVAKGYIGSLDKWWTNSPCRIDGGFYKWIPNTMSYLSDKFYEDYTKWLFHYFDTKQVTVLYAGEQNFVFEHAKGYVSAPGKYATRWQDERATQLNRIYSETVGEFSILRVDNKWVDSLALVHYSRYIG